MIGVIYLVGFFITLSMISFAYVYAEDEGMEVELDGFWVLFLCMFWPILWIIFIGGLALDGVIAGVRWLYKRYK